MSIGKGGGGRPHTSHINIKKMNIFKTKGQVVEEGIKILALGARVVGQPWE